MELPDEKNSSTGPIVHAENVTKSFNHLHALSGISIDISKGELVGFVGPDGAGKTTLMRILAGLIRPDAGKVTIMGQDPMGRSPARQSLGYMPQAYSLYGDLSVDENLKFFSRMFSISKDEYSTRRERLLHITRLHKFTNRRASALSGGMYKKLALACSLLHKPSVLLLDEPTNGVDPISRMELWELLKEFVLDGMAILISTAYMDEAVRCSRVNLMHHGKIISHGRPQELLGNFSHGAYLIQGSCRKLLEPLLESIPGVITYSPAGSRIRIVVRNEFLADTEDALRKKGASMLPTRPDFEDLFLSILSEQPQSEQT